MVYKNTRKLSNAANKYFVLFSYASVEESNFKRNDQ